MDRELTPDEIRDLLAAYAIDAVDDDERRAIDEYIELHPDLRAEVSSLQHSASFLAHTGGPPPPGVWERLEATIQGTRVPAEPAPPLRLAPRTSAGAPRTSRRWQWFAVAATIAAVALGALWLSARDSSGGGSTADLAGAAEGAPGARAARLVDADGTVLARAVVLPDGTGYLTSELPALPAGRTYQLWGVDARDTISLGVMGRDPGVVAFRAAGRPTALAVTEERAGGVPVSGNEPTAAGDLT
ncbi:MAG TPA: anti-sigma factor [Acidimicrobiia bacterium]|jgi:anti-sigma-K factor RskA